MNSNNLKDTMWTTIWVVCLCIFVWVTMAVMAMSKPKFNCEDHVGCGEHEMIQPEGHGR